MINSLNPQNLRRVVIAGILLGIITCFCPVVFIISIFAFSIIFFVQSINDEERPFFTKIIIIALSIRVIFTLIAVSYIPLMYVDYIEHPILGKIAGHSIQLFRDFHREVLNGARLGRYFVGEYGQEFLHPKKIAYEGFSSYLHFGSYFQGFLNAMFGESILNVFIYPLAGIWVVVLGYYLAKELFNREVARITAVILTVLPSIVIWACINIRMTLSIIAIQIIALSMVKFVRKHNPLYLLAIIVSLISFNLFKNKFFKPMVVITFVSFLFTFRIKLRFKLLILAGCITLAMLIPSTRYKIHQSCLDMMSHQRSFASYGSGNNYRIFEDFVYTPVDIYKSSRVTKLTLLRGLPKGVIYFLFSPFPWKITNTLRLYSYPQVLLWYFLFPFALMGMLLGIRNRREVVLPLLLFLIFWTAILSLTMGNVGTAARHRDFVAPLIYIFAGAGMLNLLGRKIT